MTLALVSVGSLVTLCEPFPVGEEKEKEKWVFDIF